MMTLVSTTGSATANSKADGSVEYTYAVGLSTGLTSGTYTSVVDFTALTAVAAVVAAPSYKVGTGVTSVTNEEVLKSIVALIASINKQIQALQKLSEKPVFEENLFTLHSKVSASEANHSYNGIIFDIESHSSYEIEVRSVSIAGMLGRVRVFARDQPWEAEKLENTNASHYWARRESLNPKGWYKIADQFCRPSWDNPIEVVDLFIYCLIIYLLFINYTLSTTYMAYFFSLKNISGSMAANSLVILLSIPLLKFSVK
jgi:hypothetical protein